MVRQLVSVLVAGVVGAAAGGARAEKDRLDVGEPVKNFTLKVVNDDVFGDAFVGIDRYVGPEAKEAKKAVLLSFFATYCEPCKRELPYLAALYDLYREKGLMIMSISIDKEQEKIDEAKALAGKANAKFPILSDRFNIVAKRFFIEKLPCVYLVDGAGKVEVVHVGYNDDISKSLFDTIRKLVGESTSDPVPDALARHMTGNTGPSSVSVPVEDAAKPPPAEVADAGGEKPTAPDEAAAAAVEEEKGKGKGKKKTKAVGKGKKKGKKK